MLVQVNETTWLRHNEIKQICISRANYINEHKHCISGFAGGVGALVAFAMWLED